MSDNFRNWDALSNSGPVRELPQWVDPFSFDYQDGPGDELKAVLQTNMETMTRNMGEIVRKAEEHWYLEIVISALEAKGYTVTKPEEAAHE